MNGPQDEEIGLSVQIYEKDKPLSELLTRSLEDEYVELDCTECECSRIRKDG